MQETELSYAKDPNADIKCVAFSPGGGWTIFWNQNGNWTAGDVPDAAFKKIVAVAKQGGTLRSVAYGPMAPGFWPTTRPALPTATSRGVWPIVLDNFAKNGIGVRCVAFTGNDWICLADGNWWTSNPDLAATKRIEQNFKENNPPTWLSFMPSAWKRRLTARWLRPASRRQRRGRRLRDRGQARWFSARVMGWPTWRPRRR